MILRVFLFIVDAFLLNVAFLLSFFFRYGLVFPEESFSPYKKSFVFLTVIYISALSFFKVYKSRFKTSWDLFKRVFLGLFLGTLLSVAFVYVFRARWGGFPTSVFVFSFFTSLFLIFKLNQSILKAARKIRKKVVIIGEVQRDDFVAKRADVERRRIDQIEELIKCADADEIVICERIQDEKTLSLLIYLVQKLKIDVLFDLSSYMELLPERINGEDSLRFLNTFIGRKADVEEFLVRSLDIIGSIIILIMSAPLVILISVLIKITSPGSIFYKQDRAGKDGKIFTLYKFRTMIKDAEKLSGLTPTLEDDPRVTKIGQFLRDTRIDELPQLLNIIRGDMSLVGPRPENLYRVKTHKALQGIRLAVKPGLTGLAQIRSFYDLHPEHKIRYDYLYIQKRSFLLNLYILAKTIPVIFSKRGR